MKKIMIMLALLPLFHFAFGQKHKATADTASNWAVYRNALLFNDLDAAKNALFELTVAQPENKAIYDSLARLYFRMGAYNQAIQASDLSTPTRAMKEIKAYSCRNLGDIKSALPVFEELFHETGSPEYGYQLATMQFSLKRYGECEETIGKVKIHPDAVTTKVLISTEQGEGMNVNYLAASENLQGVLYLDMGKPDLAKACFERALLAEPEFKLAKKNLEGINAKKETK